MPSVAPSRPGCPPPGREVLALARGSQAARVRADGLRLLAPDGSITARMAVAESPERLRLRDNDVLVIATKSQHTAGVLDAPPPTARDLPLLCAQNGVSNERGDSVASPTPTGSASCSPPGTRSPGRVAVFSEPSAVLEVWRWAGGHDDVDETVAADWSGAALITRARDDVAAYQRRKLLTNLGNAVQALLGTELDNDGRTVARDCTAARPTRVNGCCTRRGFLRRTPGSGTATSPHGCGSPTSPASRGVAAPRGRAWCEAPAAWRPTTSTARSCSRRGCTARRRRSTRRCTGQSSTPPAMSAGPAD